jgi:hypothetical protein
MRRVLLLLVFCSTGFGQEQTTPGEVVQRFFKTMATHDVNSARALFTANASLTSVRADGTTATSTFEKWLEHLAASKEKWLERTWNEKVLERAPLAVLWADYEFYLNGKFSHCGVDSFTLVKTAEGWKIAAATDTRRQRRVHQIRSAPSLAGGICRMHGRALFD